MTITTCMTDSTVILCRIKRYRAVLNVPGPCSLNLLPRMRFLVYGKSNRTFFSPLVPLLNNSVKSCHDIHGCVKRIQPAIILAYKKLYCYCKS